MFRLASIQHRDLFVRVLIEWCYTEHWTASVGFMLRYIFHYMQYCITTWAFISYLLCVAYPICPFSSLFMLRLESFNCAEAESWWTPASCDYGELLNFLLSKYDILIKYHPACWNTLSAVAVQAGRWALQSLCKSTWFIMFFCISPNPQSVKRITEPLSYILQSQVWTPWNRS